LPLDTNLKFLPKSSHILLWEHSQRKGKREMTTKRWLKTKRVGMINLAPHHPSTHAQQRKLANLGCERHGKESLSLHAFNKAADFLEREPQDLSRKEPAEKEFLICLPTRSETWWLVICVQFKRLPDRLRGVTLQPNICFIRARFIARRELHSEDGAACFSSLLNHIIGAGYG
jgi:hypothetical protein